VLAELETISDAPAPEETISDAPSPSVVNPALTGRLRPDWKGNGKWDFRDVENDSTLKGGDIHE
jgi:hypothetical protein